MNRVRAYEGAKLVYDSDTDQQSFDEFMNSHEGRLRVEVIGTMGGDTSPDFPIHERVEE